MPVLSGIDNNLQFKNKIEFNPEVVAKCMQCILAVV